MWFTEPTWMQKKKITIYSFSVFRFNVTFVSSLLVCQAKKLLNQILDCVLMIVMQLSRKRLVEKLLMTVLLHQRAILCSWGLTPAVKSITFPDEFYLYGKQSLHQIFSNARYVTDVSLTVCLSVFLLHPSFSVWVIVSISCSVGTEEAALIAKLHRAQMFNCLKLFCEVETEFDQIEGRLLSWNDWMGS